MPCGDLAFVMNLFHTNERSIAGHTENTEMTPSPKAREGMFAGYPWRCAGCDAPNDDPSIAATTSIRIASMHASAGLFFHPFSKQFF
jgi:hypothetical protein